MIVVVTGSREFSKPLVVRDALDFLLAEHDWLTVRHGGAKGADTFADEWGKWLALDREHVTVQTYPADWTTYGKAAGAIRNTTLTTELPRAGRCLAFFEQMAANRGTKDCALKADAAGIKVMAWIDGAFRPDWKKMIQQ